MDQKRVFVYPKDKDSVLLVQPADYNACNTSSYDKQFDDGSTVFDLDRAGAFFFISGVDANCRANEKLIVMVSAAAAKGAPAPSQDSPTTPPSASPSPPSGSAAGGAAQPPPPSSSSNSPATPKAPAAASNSTAAKGTPPGAAVNGAGLTAAGLAGSFVAWIGYAMLAF